MTEKRKWRKGPDGLWSSFDPVIQRIGLREVARKRIEAIGERFVAVMQRNGWQLKGSRWVRV